MKKDDNTIIWFITQFKNNRISTHAAEVAFFIVVSFFPFLMFLITLLGYTPIQQSVLEQLIAELVPGTLSELVTGWLQESYNASGTLLSITIISTLWAGSKGVNSIAFELENIYGIKERRGFTVRRLHSVIDTIIFSVMIIISLALLVYGNQIIQLIVRYFPHITGVRQLLFLARSGFSLALFVLYFTLLYSFVPKRHGTVRDEIPGAILSSILWITFSYLYSIYIDTRQGITSVYGSLTSIVLLMLWLYFCIIFVFIGALLNQYLKEHKHLNLIRSIQEFPEQILMFLKNRK